MKKLKANPVLTAKIGEAMAKAKKKMPKGSKMTSKGC